MPVSGPILVFLANGVQGRAVVRAAERRGHVVRALVRDAGPRGGAAPGVVPGDLDDPESLLTAATGVAHFVLQVPTAEQHVMVRQVRNALDAAHHAGVRSIVLKLASASRSAPCAETSFVANAAVEAMVREADVASAVVRPTMYLDNLLKPSAVADIVHHGVLSPPIAAGQRIAWTSADDCAETAILLLEHGEYGGDHRIAGPDSVTGEELATRLSAGLGRPVAYRAQSVEAFEQEAAAIMGADNAHRVASKFRYFWDDPDDADRILATPFEPTAALAGFVPTTIEAWARRKRASFR